MMCVYFKCEACSTTMRVNYFSFNSVEQKPKFPFHPIANLNYSGVQWIQRMHQQGRNTSWLYKPILTVVRHLDQCEIPSEGPPCAPVLVTAILLWTTSIAEYTVVPKPWHFLRALIGCQVALRARVLTAFNGGINAKGKQKKFSLWSEG
jgi:hypothetical protein